MKLTPRLKKWILIGLPILVGFTIFITYQFERTSTNQYCGFTCHIMTPYYETSFHNVHREENQVNCRDCHIPHDNLIETIAYKGYSGARDYYKNTFDPPDALQTKPWSQAIIQENCTRCHQTVVERVNMTDGKRCFECHRGVPHTSGTQTFSSEKIFR